MIDHYCGDSGVLLLSMPRECAEDCSTPGQPADESVAYWRNRATTPVVGLSRDDAALVADYLQLAQSTLLQCASDAEVAARFKVPPPIVRTMREHASECARIREQLLCDCAASGHADKPKQHSADPHAKNCAVYRR